MIGEKWSPILFGLVVLAVGGVVFYLRPNDAAARLMFLVGASLACSTSSWSFGLQVSDLLGGSSLWMYQVIAYGAYMTSWTAGLHFALVFPRRQARDSSWPWLVPVLYITLLGVYVLYGAATSRSAETALDWLGKGDTPANIVAVAAMSLAAVVLSARYRYTTDSVSRQQARWIVFPFVVVGAAMVSLYLLPQMLGKEPLVDLGILTLLSLVFPMAVAVAIVRHRLFDIDLLINRALVYVALTATLGATYFGSVVVLQMAFRAATGQGSDIVIVASTLGIAGLFQPIRRGLQSLIDRRFYRSKYDAARTLAAFGAAARDEVDLGRLSAALVGATVKTMQPAHVSLWLKNDNAKRQRG